MAEYLEKGLLKVSLSGLMMAQCDSFSKEKAHRSHFILKGAHDLKSL